MKQYNCNGAFLQVDMHSYLSDPRYECVMTYFLTSVKDCCIDAIDKCANTISINNENLDQILYELEVISSIENYSHMWLDKQRDQYADFTLPKWFLVALLQFECKTHDYDTIPFTLSLIQECR